MNWAVIVDISLYVVVPHRRASAEAFQLTLAHALGEAGSPYICSLIGQIFFIFEDSLPDLIHVKKARHSRTALNPKSPHRRCTVLTDCMTIK